MSGTEYKGLEIFDGTPAGDAGQALNNNFTKIADHIETSWELVGSNIIDLGDYDELFEESIWHADENMFSDNDEVYILVTVFGDDNRSGTIGIDSGGAMSFLDTDRGKCMVTMTMRSILHIASDSMRIIASIKGWKSDTYYEPGEEIFIRKRIIG